MISTLGAIGNAAIASFPIAGSSDPLTPGVLMFLGGVDLIGGDMLRDATLEVEEKVGGIRTMQFGHVAAAGGSHIPIGSRVILRQDTVNLFLGTVDRAEEKKADGAEALFTEVEAVDQGAIFDRRIVTADQSFTDRLSGDIVRDLITTHAAGEGISLNSVLDGSTVAEFTAGAGKSLAKVLRDLSDRTGFIFFVDPAGDLHWEPQTQVLAPFSIKESPTGADVKPLAGVAVSATREKYRNRQTIRYGADLDSSVTEDDLTEQAARKAIEGGTGIYHASEDAKEITSAAEATALAQALLRRFAIPTKIKLAVRKAGLRAGQTIFIDLPKHGLSGDFFIDSITLRDEGRAELFYDLDLLSGEHQGDVMDSWRAAFGREE
jgi:hypothetical protein